MLPVDFAQANCTYTKPACVTDEECSDLRAFNGRYESGLPVIISKWQPSKEDIEAINRGEAIYLSIYAENLPPIQLSTESPFQ